MINLKGKGSRMWWTGWTITNIIYVATSNSFLQLFAILTPIILAYHNPAKDRKPTTIAKKILLLVLAHPSCGTSGVKSSYLKLLLSPQNLKPIYHNVRNTKTKKRRDRVRNLRDINRILSRKLGDTQKYLSQQIKNI